MMKESDYILLGKYLTGNASPEEVREVEEWKALNQAAFEEMKWIWEASNSIENISFDKTDAWAKLQTQMKTPSPVPLSVSYRKTRMWLTIAASLLALLTLGWWLFQPDGSAIQVMALSETKTIELADGSTVSLREGSQISYDASFNKKTRIVRMSGEAFFDVAPNANKPFVIETDRISIRVLGTSFNVNTFDKEMLAVTVAEGKVAVQSKANPKEKTTLGVGEKGVLQQGKLKKMTNDDQNYLSWKTGTFAFDGTSVPTVFEKLNDYYDNAFVLKTGFDSSCNVTSTFEKTSLEDVMRTLEAICGLSFQDEKIDGKTVYHVSVAQ